MANFLTVAAKHCRKAEHSLQLAAGSFNHHAAGTEPNTKEASYAEQMNIARDIRKMKITRKIHIVDLREIRELELVCNEHNGAVVTVPRTIASASEGI